MRNVHYFPRYSQKENVVTNNTLLLFLRLMESSRMRFEAFLEKLAGDADLRFAPEWLRIGQQKSTGVGVVDGFIAQDSIKIAVETKLDTTFNSQQLQRHLEIFKDENHKLLVLLCPSTPFIGSGLEGFREAAERRGVEILATSFERIISVMREVVGDRDEGMIELLRDFEEFCSATNLLPDDKFFMFTPPCGPSHADNERLRLYYCPADRNQRNAAYLGIYANKVVRAIGRIRKVVACSVDESTDAIKVISGGSVTKEEESRIAAAVRGAHDHGWDISNGHKFYLCDEWASMSFRKASPNGIQGHRMLDLRREFNGPVPQSVKEIAAGLDGKVWQQG